MARAPLAWLALYVGALAWAPARAQVPTPTTQPASQPASGPTSGPAPSPAVIDESPAGAETISDPMDDGWAPAPPPARETTGAVGGAVSGPGTIFRARALLRLSLDTWHEGPRPGGQATEYIEDVMELFGQALAHVEHRVSRRVKLKVGGRLRYRLTTRRPAEADATYVLFNGTYHRNDFLAEPQDSFIALSYPWFDLRAGLVTEVWGTTDLVNPNDVLAAQDLQVGPFLDPETARLPSPMIKGDLYVKGFALQVNFMPVFVAHRLEMFGSDYSMFGPMAPKTLQWLGALADDLVDDSIKGVVQDALVQTRLPRPFEDSMLGVRLSRNLRGWDLALQYAWLFERLPVFRFKPDLSILPLLLGPPGALGPDEIRAVATWLLSDPCPVESVYHRFHHAGLSLSGPLWRMVLNLDLAYQSRQSAALAGPVGFVTEENGWLSTAVESQVVAYTVGLTYTRGDELLVSLEWWHRILVDEALASGKDRHELILGGPNQGGLAMLARYQLSVIDLALQLLVHSDLLNGSLILTPQVSYRMGDHLGVMAGVNIFEGREQSLGGRLDQNDQVYLGVEGFL